MTDASNNENVGATTPDVEEVNCSAQQDNAEAAQNTPVLCWNCGEALEQDQLFCPKCGSKADAPLEKNTTIAEFNENNAKKKKAKKKKLIVILSIVLAVLLVGGAASYVFYFEPNARYTEAVSLYNDGKYEEASTLFAELGNFKDSSDRVAQCDTAIKQEKYDEAIKKAANNKYGEAISMLTELGDFSDSKAKITELESKYYGLLQQIYAYVARGFDTDTALANCVYGVLLTSELYDAYDSLAMSHLYEGTSYRTYYYFSRYNNGYAYVVEYDTAQAFVSLLDLTNDNAVDIDLLLLSVANPPQKYKALYDKVKSMCSTYSTFHKFVSKEPSVSYSSYESTSKSHQTSVKNAMDTVKKADSKIADKTSVYDWD